MILYAHYILGDWVLHPEDLKGAPVLPVTLYPYPETGKVYKSFHVAAADNNLSRATTLAAVTCTLDAVGLRQMLPAKTKEAS